MKRAKNLTDADRHNRASKAAAQAAKALRRAAKALDGLTFGPRLEELAAEVEHLSGRCEGYAKNNW